VLPGHREVSEEGAEAGTEELFGISSKSVCSIAANNFACDLRNSRQHQIRDLAPSFGKEEDAMKQKDAANRTFIHSQRSAGSQTLPAQVPASQDKSIFILFVTAPRPFLP